MSSVLGFALPNSWSSAPLKHVTSTLKRGSAPTYVDAGPVRVISQASNQASGLDWSRARFHNFSGNPKSLKGYLCPNDVLINSTGTGTLGRVGYFTDSPDGLPCMADSHVTIARAKPDQLHARFSYYWLSSSLFQEYTYTALVVGATNQIELNRERLGDAPVPLPPLDEQRRIADFLDAETSKLGVLDERFKKLTGLLEERKAALIEECFTFNAADGAPVLPFRRAVKRWIDYRGATPEKTTSGIPLVTAKNIRHGRIDLDVSREFIATDAYADWMRRGLLEVDDVLLTTEAPLGQVAMVNNTYIALAQRVIVLRADQDVCSAEWLYWYLLSPQGQAELELRSTGSTALGIKADRLRGVPIPLPTLGEATQRLGQLADRVTQIEILQRKLTEQRALVTERRQALITAAVTGQFDVTTASGRNVTEGVSA
ncbi:restriction endonuclease subunit S [Streptomyces sp. enrichment culture]|uniref:restriction endonuclease subunit S n=1 Tax=Streptomyces sp. enrichment culture TaxID=1795815 RepID=UPI003F572639